ncbi:hypothetical protein JHK87_031348 [Glycine soja]|nr:hypothetical protein JHK87_031348 [Glycine soja]
MESVFTSNDYRGSLKTTTLHGSVFSVHLEVGNGLSKDYRAKKGSEGNFRSFHSHLLKAQDGFPFAGVKSLTLRSTMVLNGKYSFLLLILFLPFAELSIFMNNRRMLSSEGNIRSFHSHLLKAQYGFPFAGVKSLMLRSTMELSYFLSFLILQLLKDYMFVDVIYGDFLLNKQVGNNINQSEEEYQLA